jgi:hypothetical protein
MSDIYDSNCHMLFSLIVLNCKIIEYKINKEKEEREEKEKKRSWRYTETSMMTLLISLERSRRNESNNIKECHKL